MTLYFLIGRLGNIYGVTPDFGKASTFLAVKPGRKVVVVSGTELKLPKSLAPENPTQLLD